VTGFFRLDEIDPETARIALLGAWRANQMRVRYRTVGMEITLPFSTSRKHAVTSCSASSHKKFGMLDALIPARS
jgi:hypothetical protein